MSKTRLTYRNGNAKTLIHQNCDQCDAIFINGKLCHEIGCPDSWKDYAIECKECGTLFIPAERYQDCCSESCSEMYHG
jgi:hypothetical protein